MRNSIETLQEKRLIDSTANAKSDGGVRSMFGFFLRCLRAATNGLPRRSLLSVIGSVANLSTRDFPTRYPKKMLRVRRQTYDGIKASMGKFASGTLIARSDRLQCDAALESCNQKVALHKITPVTEQRRCVAA